MAMATVCGATRQEPMLGRDSRGAFRHAAIEALVQHPCSGCRREVGVCRSVVADPRCPRASRWLLGGAVAYALSPLDLIPDFIPVLGHIDGLFVLPALIWLALRGIPRELIAEHRSRYEGRV
jgi:uncharacterized membrane protein YkvA (DUF1232 family)